MDGQFLIGEGGTTLLSAVAARGSLAEAAREMGWSYRHAWGYLRRAEVVLGAPLIETRLGKGASRGARLTRAGHRLVAQLLDVRQRFDRVIHAVRTREVN